MWKPPSPVVKLPDCQQNWDSLTKNLNVLPIFTSTVTDSVFPRTPIDGTVVLENVGGVRKLCARIGGVWFKVTLA